MVYRSLITQIRMDHHTHVPDAMEDLLAEYQDLDTDLYPGILLVPSLQLQRRKLLRKPVASRPRTLEVP